MSRSTIFIYCLVISLGWNVPTAPAAVPLAAEDAALRAVQFLDDKEGWAVGDRGTVWHSIDGGASWERMPCGTQASLRGVHFVTPYVGCVVGRQDTADGAESIGVVLTTDDGGLSWRELAQGRLPGLNAVHMSDGKRLVVGGDGSRSFPSGLFLTTDGGQSWTPLPGPQATSWRSLDFSGKETSLAVGHWGRVWRFHHQNQQPNYQTEGRHDLNGVASCGKAVVAVGNRGTILRSENAGEDWQQVELELPEGLAGLIDFRSVVAVGEKLWAVGRPGSVLFRSDNGGRSWQTKRTGSPVPLNGVFMLDASTGWAVGELGTILKTEDGGDSWRVKKSGGQRAAVLTVNSKAEDLPLSTIAGLAGQEGYLSVAHLLCSADPVSAAEQAALEPFRLGAMVDQLGGSAVEFSGLLPLPAHSDGLPVELLFPPQDRERFIRSLVMTIRTWRPELVIVDPAPPRSEFQKEVLLAVQAAFVRAADPEQYPEQIRLFGLQPHGPKKLVALADQTHGNLSLNLARFVPALGDSPGALGVEAATRLGNTGQTSRYRLLAHRLNDAETHTELLEGIELAEGGSARRKKPRLKLGNAGEWADREAAMHKRDEIEKQAKTPAAFGGIERVTRSAVGQMEVLPDDMAARLLAATARRFSKQGESTAARELYTAIITEYASHPEAAEAARWLIRFHASSESLRRIELGHQPIFPRLGFESTLEGPVQLTAGETGPAKLVRQAYRFASPEAERQWLAGTLSLEETLIGFGPTYFRDPETQLGLLSVKRRLAKREEMARILKAMLQSSGGLSRYQPGQSAWRDSLAAELWLIEPGELPAQPKPVYDLATVTQRPHLDGELDDDCWKEAKSVPLADRVGQTAANYRTTAKLCRDEQFLYLGVVCEHPQGGQKPLVEKRVYDADLSASDRIELILDLDRDYGSYYRLRVDQQGQVADDCSGDAGWNPRWFVAVQPSETGWTAEIAIPLAELRGGIGAEPEVWAGNLVRVLPGQGVQSWSGPADATPRLEGLGLIRVAENGQDADPAVPTK